MKTLLKGGTVVSAAASRAADVLIEGEKILAVGENLPADGAAVVDVTGKLLFPGFHRRPHALRPRRLQHHHRRQLRHRHAQRHPRRHDHSSSTSPARTRASRCSTASISGTKRPTARSSCDYGFHMTIDDWNEAIRAEIPAMFAAGIPSFKMYMTYPAMMIGDQDMFCALQELKKLRRHRRRPLRERGRHRRAHRRAQGRGADRPVVPPRVPPEPAGGRGRRAPAAHRRGRRRARRDRPPEHEGGPARGHARPRPRSAGLRRDLPALSAARRQRVLPGGLFRRRALHLRAAHAEKGGPGGPLEGAGQRHHPDRLHRPLQLHPAAEGRRQGRLHEDPRRPARRGDARRAALYLRAWPQAASRRSRCARLLSRKSRAASTARTRARA